MLLKYFPFIVDAETKKAKYYSIKDIESGLYAIKLVNAIQFQCSLGADTEPSEKSKGYEQCYRDNVFIEMWDDNNEVSESFVKRVKESRPDIIINCCTKGNLDKKHGTLRGRVQKAINVKCKNLSCLLLSAAHPSRQKFKDGLSWIDEGEEQI